MVVLGDDVPTFSISSTVVRADGLFILSSYRDLYVHYTCSIIPPITTFSLRLANQCLETVYEPI